MNLDPTIIRSQIEALKLSCPEAWEDGDDVLLNDMLEAQTSVKEFLTVVADRLRDATSMAGGIAGRIAELELRQRRYERREQAMREITFKVMQTAALRRLELPEVTLSVRNGTPKVQITDEACLPADFVRTKTEPDRAKIKGALTSGADVPGACLSNAEPTLAILTR